MPQAFFQYNLLLYFSLLYALRRQIHRDFRKPLIIMSPKSLLRNKKCVSNIEDFTRKNSFHRVLGDHAEINAYGLIKLEKDTKIKKFF